MAEVDKKFPLVTIFPVVVKILVAGLNVMPLFTLIVEFEAVAELAKVR